MVAKKKETKKATKTGRQKFLDMAAGATTPTAV